MTYKMTPGCMELLARAYYGLDLLGSSTGYKRQSLHCSIKANLRLQWIGSDHRITEQGLWELRRAVSKERQRIGTQ